VVETVHPVEVGAAQEAHLIQWLSRRVGHPLTVPDLAGQGYVLMGGRVLPAGKAAAAQFMYENGSGHRLTVYIRASGGGDTQFRFVDSQGIAAFSWIDQGLGFAIVGAMDRLQLLDIADTVYRQVDPQHRTAPADL
jgi:anti-sigma factor RsiW